MENVTRNEAIIISKIHVLFSIYYISELFLRHYTKWIHRLLSSKQIILYHEHENKNKPCLAMCRKYIISNFSPVEIEQIEVSKYCDWWVKTKHDQTEYFKNIGSSCYTRIVVIELFSSDCLPYIIDRCCQMFYDKAEIVASCVWEKKKKNEKMLSEIAFVVGDI